MRSTPTNPQRELCQGIEDYETKVSITLRMRGQSPQARGPLDALVGRPCSADENIFPRSDAEGIILF